MSSPVPEVPLPSHNVVTAIRALSVDIVEAAGSGHPGLPLGAAPIAATLFMRHLRHNPKDPKWPDRDRFVLSAGHGSALLYAMLHLCGYDLPMEQLRRFRQWQSLTPGHPEYGLTPGVEMTTGPLGQGISSAVGMAIAERHLAADFNRPGYPIVDHYTYALVSDGDLMEGVAHEAASLAGHLKLSRLIAFYDQNQISLDAPTSVSFTEDVPGRFRALGWHVQEVSDAEDLEAISAAIDAAKKTSVPSLIAVRTHLGFGSPKTQDTPAAHGSPLGPEEAKRTKENLGWRLPPFDIPKEVREAFSAVVRRGEALQRGHEDLLSAYARNHPEAAGAFEARFLPPSVTRSDLPRFSPDDAMATRSASGTILQAVAEKVPQLVGGSADLSSSNKTNIEAARNVAPGSYGGRNIHYGVREHAMAAISNGMALHGGILPLASTFLIFSDYLRPALRLSALMNLSVLYIFTHDSIGLGQDGPTHQPIAQLAALRAIPNLTVYRPADANETAGAWVCALADEGPSAFALSRQNLPVLSEPGPDEIAAGVARGAYILKEAEGGDPEGILIASGSEVHVALGAQRLLAGQGRRVRVVSMPSMERFAKAPQSWRDEVLPPGVKARLGIEAAASLGWHRWVGPDGDLLTLDHFGASAPAEKLFEAFGFTDSEAAGRLAAAMDHLGQA